MLNNFKLCTMSLEKERQKNNAFSSKTAKRLRMEKKREEKENKARDLRNRRAFKEEHQDSQRKKTA